MERTITVADGYNGSTVTLNAECVLDSLPDGSVKLHVVGKPHLIRWVSAEDFRLIREENDDAEPFAQGPDTQF
jgi:hypothetical protein